MSELPNTHALILEPMGSVLKIWLNRPDARNALSAEMVKELDQVLDAVRDDRSIRTIVLRGKGGAGFGGGPSGNALVTLTVSPHATFRRDGNDIVTTLPITIDTAVLGGKVEVPTIDGTVNLSIPKGASGGQILRLRGRGVKPAGSKTHGDQRVELRIVSPPEIDDELAEFMENWRKKHAYDPNRGQKA